MALYSKIEQVSASGQYGNTGEAGWGFHMWTDLDDDESPHRKVLEHFSVDHPDADIVFPEYYPEEDYIESSAKWGASSLRIYYETILGYLWIWSDDREAVESFRTELLRYVS